MVLVGILQKPFHLLCEERHHSPRPDTSPTAVLRLRTQEQTPLLECSRAMS